MCLTVIIAAQAGVGIYGAVNKNEISQSITQSVEKFWNYKTNKAFVDEIQKDVINCLYFIQTRHFHPSI